MLIRVLLRRLRLAAITIALPLFRRTEPSVAVSNRTGRLASLFGVLFAVLRH